MKSGKIWSLTHSFGIKKLPGAFQEHRVVKLSQCEMRPKSGDFLELLDLLGVWAAPGPAFQDNTCLCDQTWKSLN